MKLADATEAATRDGRAVMAKMESRIRELEMELGNMQSRTGDNYKGHQKAERKLKELTFQQEEERKNQERMSDLPTSFKPRSKHTRNR